MKTLIKLPEYRKYKYKPLYYDKRKENLEEKIKKEKDKKEAIKRGEYKPDFKGKFRRSYSKDITKKQKKAANIRLAVILVFLSATAYIIIRKSDIIEKMFSVLISK
ncbi:MAG: hypothetical protein GXO50_03505 [Chlorobi bacterium]|nr:hypothetical protein [Chlorobiota bacterium]